MSETVKKYDADNYDQMFVDFKFFPHQKHYIPTKDVVREKGWVFNVRESDDYKGYGEINIKTDKETKHHPAGCSIIHPDMLGWLNDKDEYSRLDGPAVIHCDKEYILYEWNIDDVRKRDDGPAFVKLTPSANGVDSLEAYFIGDDCYPQDEYLEVMKDKPGYKALCTNIALGRFVPDADRIDKLFDSFNTLANP